MRWPSNLRSKRALKCGAIGIALMAASSFVLPKFLIWNVSASLPEGLYLRVPDDNIRLGQIAVIDPPPELSQWMDERAYLPVGMPLLKTIAATSGNRVCRDGNTITVRSEIIAIARESDRLGRSLPRWQGCRRIGPDELFFVSQHNTDSLDSRYFGPLAASSVSGRAVPIWTQDDE